MAWLAQFAGGVISGCIYGQFLSVFIASCWLFTFVAEDITQDVTAFNRQSTKAVKCRAELKKRFCDIIQTYSDAKQWEHQSNCHFLYLQHIHKEWMRPKDALIPRMWWWKCPCAHLVDRSILYELPWISNLFSRCITEFNQINEYSLFAFFLWDMLAISSTLVTLQFQLVK